MKFDINSYGQPPGSKWEANELAIIEGEPHPFYNVGGQYWRDRDSKQFVWSNPNLVMASPPASGKRYQVDVYAYEFATNTEILDQTFIGEIDGSVVEFLEGILPMGIRMLYGIRLPQNTYFTKFEVIDRFGREISRIEVSEV